MVSWCLGGTMDKLYMQYAELLGETTVMELDLNDKKRALFEIYAELDMGKKEDGSYGIELSAHAMTNINDRLYKLGMENSIIYADVFNVSEPSKSILWPCNLRAFVIGMLASARSKNSYSEKPSKNTAGGKEYHYEVEIKKWGTDEMSLIFTAIVESNIIKTGYFNWKENK